MEPESKPRWRKWLWLLPAISRLPWMSTSASDW